VASDTIIFEFGFNSFVLFTKFNYLSTHSPELLDFISNETNSEDESDWSLVHGKKKKTSVLLVGTSNIKGIEPSQLSTKYHTSKETAYTIDQAINS
jgi:hypothetical protein